MSDYQLTLHDQALANWVIYLAVAPMRDDAHEAMVLAILENELLGRVSTHNPRMEGIIDAAELLVAAKDRGLRGSDWTRARFEASRAAGEFTSWRGSLSLDAIKTQKGDAA